MKKLALMMAGALMAAVPVLAHHSFSAEFDRDKPVSFTGTVVKIDWMNPHTWIYVDAKDASGNITHWQCETGAPNELVRRGWKKNSLKVGEVVTVNGFRAKDGTNTANAREVVLPSGLQVFSGSSDDGGPQPRVGRGRGN
jgi:Family of unknown function (DUF6152)